MVVSNIPSTFYLAISIVILIVIGLLYFLLPRNNIKKLFGMFFLFMAGVIILSDITISYETLILITLGAVTVIIFTIMYIRLEFITTGRNLTED